MFELKLTLEELRIIEDAMRKRVDLYNNTHAEERVLQAIQKAINEKFNR